MTCFERAPANKKRLTLIAVFVMLFASVLQSGTDSVILALAAGTQLTRWLPFWLFPENKEPPAVVA